VITPSRIPPQCQLLVVLVAIIPACLPAEARANDVNRPTDPDGWSVAVNGLQARISAFGKEGARRSETDTIFLELRNPGEQPLTIPALSLSIYSNDFPWHLQVRQAAGWKECPWIRRDPPATAPSESDASSPGVSTATAPNLAKEPPILLRHGETAMLSIEGNVANELSHSEQLRIVIQQSGKGPVTGWSGTLESPPVPAHMPEPELVVLRGKRAAPTYLPPLNRVGAVFLNGLGNESAYAHLSVSNRPLFAHLSLYDDASIARELESRIAGEKDFALQLLLAEEASRRGSVPAKNFISSAMNGLDYQKVTNTLDCLKDLIEEDATPDWVFDAVIAALKDQRQLTNLPQEFEQGTILTVRSLASGSLLVLRLGDKKCRRAVPVLMDLALKSNDPRDAIEALGEIGDLSSVPTLAQIVKDQHAELRIWGGMLQPETYVYALRSLARMKASGIEDELLKNLVHEHVVQMIEEVGDPRAIPSLRQLITNKKPKSIEGSDAQSDRSAVEAARIALATLEPGDPIPRYCALVQDQSLNEFMRREAIWRLRKDARHDPQAIPVLLKAAHDDSSGTVVDNAIEALSEYHRGAAIAGLIDLFDAHYEGKGNWKYAYTPEMFREHVAESLETITGQGFGIDPQAWRKWWASQDQKAFN